jgi:hypothetical protein
VSPSGPRATSPLRRHVDLVNPAGTLRDGRVKFWCGLLHAVMECEALSGLGSNKAVVPRIKQLTAWIEEGVAAPAPAPATTPPSSLGDPPMGMGSGLAQSSGFGAPASPAAPAAGGGSIYGGDGGGSGGGIYGGSGGGGGGGAGGGGNGGSIAGGGGGGGGGAAAPPATGMFAGMDEPVDMFVGMTGVGSTLAPAPAPAPAPPPAFQPAVAAGGGGGGAADPWEAMFAAGGGFGSGGGGSGGGGGGGSAI